MKCLPIPTGKEKGARPLAGRAPVLIGGAKRDRTADLYNAIEQENSLVPWLKLPDNGKGAHGKATA
jgi:hypothetical protein